LDDKERAPRYVPLVSGVVALAAATTLLALWTAPSGFSSWVRGTIFALLTWFGLWDLKVAAFASDDQVRRATGGDVDVWKEDKMGAPSAFKLQDVLFLVFTLCVLLIFIVIVGLLLGLF
jgi:hypothetical protein